MATLIATGNDKRKKVLKNVSEANIDRKVEELYDAGYTNVDIQRAPVKRQVSKQERDTALPAYATHNRSIEDFLG